MSSEDQTNEELSSIQRKQLKAQELLLKRKKLEIYEGLPHLYGFKFYRWAREFFESQNHMLLLTAANQISKSSTQIRKSIHWATAPNLWPKLWGRRPTQFWYLYPSKDVAFAEWKTKWEPEFMPRGVFKGHPQFGYTTDASKKEINWIQFNTGVTILFKTYKQDPQTLQSGTVYYIACDEELPEHLLPELQARLFATNGYFSSVFTPTLNQDLWRRAMECQGTKDEAFPGAHKLQVSMYDCLTYEDGTPSPWSEERIREVEAQCKSKLEVQRRVHGRFVQEQGRKYPTFDPEKHYVKPFPITVEHKIYTAVDIGGGIGSHPAAVCFIAVTPDFKKGYVVKSWRGDGLETTTGDILQRYLEMRGNLMPTVESYDWQSKDFGIIARRMGISFVPAQKQRDAGEDMVNTLFRNDMLFLFDNEENRKLGNELLSLMNHHNKTHAKDDLSDALRYAVMPVSWDWTAIPVIGLEEKEKVIESRPLTEAEFLALQIRERRGELGEKQPTGWEEFEEEFDFWNTEY